MKSKIKSLEIIKLLILFIKSHDLRWFIFIFHENFIIFPVYRVEVIETLVMTVDQRSIKTLSQYGQLFTTNNLLTLLPDETINNTINDVKDCFINHVWYELLQKRISKYAM